MSKSYNKSTLNDNWFEERAGPLNGVIPDQKQIQNYSTESHEKFQGKVEKKELTWSQKQRNHARQGKGLSMVQLENFDQIYVPRNAGHPEKGFGSVLPAPDNEDETRRFDTSNHSDFGVGSKDSYTKLSNIRKGKVHASGIKGEDRKNIDEPQNVEGNSIQGPTSFHRKAVLTGGSHKKDGIFSDE